jgi:hypothetical protein
MWFASDARSRRCEASGARPVFFVTNVRGLSVRWSDVCSSLMLPARKRWYRSKSARRFLLRLSRATCARMMMRRTSQRCSAHGGLCISSGEISSVCVAIVQGVLLPVLQPVSDLRLPPGHRPETQKADCANWPKGGLSLARFHHRESDMRSFVAACLASFIIAAVAATVLDKVVQKPASVAFSTTAVRL